MSQDIREIFKALREYASQSGHNVLAIEGTQCRMFVTFLLADLISYPTMQLT